MVVFLTFSIILTVSFTIFAVRYHTKYSNDPLPQLFEQHNYVYTQPVSDVERYYIYLKQAVGGISTMQQLFIIKRAIMDFHLVYGSGSLYVDLCNEFSIVEKKVLSNLNKNK